MLCFEKGFESARICVVSTTNFLVWDSPLEKPQHNGRADNGADKYLESDRQTGRQTVTPPHNGGDTGLNNAGHPAGSSARGVSPRTDKIRRLWPGAARTSLNESSGEIFRDEW